MIFKLTPEAARALKDAIANVKIPAGARGANQGPLQVTLSGDKPVSRRPVFSQISNPRTRPPISAS